MLVLPVSLRIEQDTASQTTHDPRCSGWVETFAPGDALIKQVQPEGSDVQNGVVVGFVGEITVLWNRNYRNKMILGSECHSQSGFLGLMVLLFAKTI